VCAVRAQARVAEKAVQQEVRRSKEASVRVAAAQAAAGAARKRGSGAVRVMQKRIIR